MYNDGDYKKFKGRRLLALDGSTLRLPNSKETREHFGVIPYVNGKKTRTFDRVEGKMTALYDVLNKIPVSAYLTRGRTNDIKASSAHFGDFIEGDIVLCDRAFGSYRFFADLKAKKADFVVRCKAKTFAKYHKLDDSSKCCDTTVMIHPSGYAKQGEKVESMKVRFIKVKLPNGETEILATSLLDSKKFTKNDFNKLYAKRWGVETYFQTLKSRLAIDNFTGKSVENILQDFYSTIFVSGLETIITADANDELKKRKTKNRLKVNKAVSFNHIKNTVIQLALIERPPNLEEKITKLFLQNPVSVRPNRIKEPRNPADIVTVKALNFQKYARKHVF